ncbi:MAG: PadR family transcriptional regulator [Promethearchaeota archaeon]|nr:MAG: PadR family transcriptional regulator [Candidatus Lokiarchaeota archaeon]
MWLGKFLDLKEDIKDMAFEIRKKIKENIKGKQKLTPLEFTILEFIFNNKGFSGYDLIQRLNDHFAGSWTAQSGTIYPILSKLKSKGFLKIKQVKSEIGPLKKVYFLTDSGERILKVKVNNNFREQMKFIKNFLIELTYVYIHSLSDDAEEKEIDGRIEEVQELLKKTFNGVIKGIPSKMGGKITCPGCCAELDQREASYCSFCGIKL